ncbi:SH3 domain-containing protein, partial [Burkholderia sp. Cy-637]|uniref:SH3 domain-containing protein n=1 Tax=Burkholderia sp. Cy-637 TaxID=2608327 RepID=UPI00141F4F8B
MRKQFIGAVLAGMIAVFAAPSLAQTPAVTSMTVNLYAGPAGDYPVVAQLPAGASVTVMGCVSGYSWCDVSLPGLRGWAYGRYLSYPYQGASVPLSNYGATIGLPVVTFALGAYWGSYYRDRPWFGNQSRWNRHPGPAGDDPVVAQLPAGASVTVMGCGSGDSWGDVSLPGLRGWAYGRYLSYPDQGASVPLSNYGATIGLPVVTFALGAYWGSDYRERPWFGNQSRWNRHPGPR